jgi:hypothetical protein
MTAARTACRICGTELGEYAKFCDKCGGPIPQVRKVAEYKQVTVPRHLRNSVTWAARNQVSVDVGIWADRSRIIRRRLVRAASSPSSVIRSC